MKEKTINLNFDETTMERLRNAFTNLDSTPLEKETDDEFIKRVVVNYLTRRLKEYEVGMAEIDARETFVESFIEGNIT